MEDALLELLETPDIHGNAVILLPTAYHTGQPPPCLTNGVVAAAPKLLAKFRQLTTKTFGHRATLKRDSTLPGRSPEMCQTKKVERLALVAVTAVAFGRPSSKLNQTRFGRMQLQAKIRHPLR